MRAKVAKASSLKRFSKLQNTKQRLPSSLEQCSKHRSHVAFHISIDHDTDGLIPSANGKRNAINGSLIAVPKWPLLVVQNQAGLTSCVSRVCICKLVTGCHVVHHCRYVGLTSN